MAEARGGVGGGGAGGHGHGRRTGGRGKGARGGYSATDQSAGMGSMFVYFIYSLFYTWYHTPSVFTASLRPSEPPQTFSMRHRYTFLSTAPASRILQEACIRRKHASDA